MIKCQKHVLAKKLEKFLRSNLMLVSNAQRIMSDDTPTIDNNIVNVLKTWCTLSVYSPGAS